MARERRLADPNCPLCRGAGHIFVDTDSIVPVIGRTCSCVLKAARYADVASRVESARIPSRYADASFERFSLRNTTTVQVYDSDRRTHIATPQNRIDAKNLALARSLAEEPLVDETVAFIGPYGVGKTYLAAALLLAQIRAHGKTGLYLVVADYIARLLPDGADPAEQRELQRFARQVDILLLDDLGTEKGSAFALRQLWALLHDRTSNGRATILTSNLSIRDALIGRSTERTATTPDQREALELGARIYSRLTETRVPPITWPEGSSDVRWGQQGAANRPALREARRELRRELVSDSAFDDDEGATR